MSDTKNETETKASAMPAADKPGEKALHPRRKAVIAGAAAVAVVAVCAGGFAAWRVHENRLDEQARTDCSQAAKTLDTSRATWEKLLKDAKTGAGAIQANQVKDAKTVDALKQAMGAKTPTGGASCTAGGRNDVENAATAIRKAAGTYDTDARTLRTAVKAVEASRLDKTVADASKLLDDTKGKVSDDRTRQTLDKAIKARDEQAIAKAVKAVNDSKAAKEKADAEAKSKAEQEAAAAAAAQQAQQQASSSTYSSSSYGYGSGYSGSGYSSSNSGYSSGSGSTASAPSASTPSQSTGITSNSGSSNSSAGASDGFDWNAGDQYDCKPGKFCPLG